MLSQFGPSTWVAILLGSLLAFLCFIPLVAHRYRRAGRLRLVDLLILLAVTVCSVALWSYTLIPLPESATYRCIGANLRPFEFVADIAANHHAPLANHAFLQAAFNVVFFMPLGFFLRLLTRLGTWTITGLGFLTSLAIETTQLTGVWGLFRCAYREFDVDDLILNTTGALLGCLVALPVARVVRRQRTPPAATTVSIGRRLVGVLVDLSAVFLIGLTCVVAWRTLALYVLGLSVDALPGWADQLAFIGVSLALEGFWVLARGQTVGEDVVMLQPVARAGRRGISRLVKFATGVGGYLLLLSDLVPSGWWLALFAVASTGWAIWSRDHRGMSHTLAGMELRIERPDDARDAASEPE